MKAGKRRTSVWLAAVLMGLLLAAGGCSGDDDTVYNSEGALSAPLDISGTNPYQGTVGGTPSYYQVTVNTAASITVTLSGMRYDLDLVVYDNPNMFIDPPLCASVTIDIADETCAAMTATGTPIYIKVISHSEFGSTFSLSLVEI